MAFPLVDEAWRAAVLLAALATEFLDGQIARRFHWESRQGRILDPIADRAVFGSVAITLLVHGQISTGTFAALGSRDVLVAAGALWLMLRGHGAVLRKMKPRPAGKITTALQYVVLLCVVFGYASPLPLTLAILGIGLVAAAQYLADARRLL